MEWSNDDAFGWFERVYERTLAVARVVPPEQVTWQPAPGEYTCGDIIRHIGSTEVMNMARYHTGKLNYAGHGEQFGQTHSDVIGYLERCHAEALRLLDSAGADLLARPVMTNQGRVPGWRLFVGALEHEIHHRSQLCSYLTVLGIAPPPLYGLYVEDLPA